MSIRDIYTRLTQLAVSLPILSFLAVLIAEALLPHSTLASYTTALFRWATIGVTVYFVLAVGLLMAWGVQQAWVARHLIFDDGTRKAIVHRPSGQPSDEYEPLDFSWPTPRRSSLSWLDEEINDILAKGEPTRG